MLVALVLVEFPAHIVRKRAVGINFLLLLVVQGMLPICLLAGHGLSFCRSPFCWESCFPQNCLCLSFCKIYFLSLYTQDLSYYTCRNYWIFIFVKCLLRALLSSCLLKTCSQMVWSGLYVYACSCCIVFAVEISCPPCPPACVVCLSKS